MNIKKNKKNNWICGVNYKGQIYITLLITFLIMSLYMTLKLNEPVYNVSDIRMFKNCQWTFFIDCIFNDHIIQICDNKIRSLFIL